MARRIRKTILRRSQRTYVRAPSVNGSYWVRRDDETTGKSEELKASVMPEKTSGAGLLAKIDGRPEGYCTLSFWAALGFTKWRTRTMTPQPAARWAAFLRDAVKRLAKRGGMKPGVDPVEVIAAEIVASNNAAAFLKAVRRGRSTHRQNLRYRILREVERLAGDTVARRREDHNTPDAVALRNGADFTLSGEA